jgi:hypothetical protein
MMDREDVVRAETAVAVMVEVVAEESSSLTLSTLTGSLLAKSLL